MNLVVTSFIVSLIFSSFSATAETLPPEPWLKASLASSDGIHELRFKCSKRDLSIPENGEGEAPSPLFAPCIQYQMFLVNLISKNIENESSLISEFNSIEQYDDFCKLPAADRGKWVYCSAKRYYEDWSENSHFGQAKEQWHEIFKPFRMSQKKSWGERALKRTGNALSFLLFSVFWNTVAETAQETYLITGNLTQAPWLIGRLKTFSKIAEAFRQETKIQINSKSFRRLAQSLASEENVKKRITEELNLQAPLPTP